jgi:hypothetical protein
MKKAAAVLMTSWRAFLRSPKPGFSAAADKSTAEPFTNTNHKTMKKLLFTLVTLATCASAFAQGKLRFENDSLHLVFYNPFGDPVPPFPGQGVDAAHMPPGATLLADLYVGTTSTSLSLISSTTFSSSPGKWDPINTVVTGIPGGTTVFVMAQVRDSSSPAESIWTPGFIPNGSPYWGFSDVFHFTLGTSAVNYPPIWGGDPAWPVGTFNMDQYGVGSRGAIAVPYIPEPSAIALVGLGSLTMLLRHRAKRTFEKSKPSQQ